MSATQSLMSALRSAWLDEFDHTAEGTRPTNTGVNPMRPVLASGKESAAKAKMCTTLSLPGAGGGASGAEHRTVRVMVTMRVIGISKYFRIS